MPRYPKKSADIWPTLTPKLQEARRRRLQAAEPRPSDILPLKELRRSRGVSQAALAHAMVIRQPGISRLEHQGDIQLSTRRKYVEALGGRLEIVARFPKSAIQLHFRP